MIGTAVFLLAWGTLTWLFIKSDEAKAAKSK